MFISLSLTGTEISATHITLDVALLVLASDPNLLSREPCRMGKETPVSVTFPFAGCGPFLSQSERKQRTETLCSSFTLSHVPFFDFPTLWLLVALQNCGGAHSPSGLRSQGVDSSKHWNPCWKEAMFPGL